MASGLLGPQDLKQLGQLPTGSKIRGTVKLVKRLKPAECLEFCLMINDNCPGPIKRARVTVRTGIRNAGMNVEPLLRAEAILNKAMAAAQKVVLHTGLPGCILTKHELVQKQGRREVDLVLESGSKVEVPGTGELVDFYRDPAHGDNDWFSSPEDDQVTIKAQTKVQSTVTSAFHESTHSRPLKPLTELTVPPRLREPGPEMEITKKMTESVPAGVNGHSTNAGRVQKPTKVRPVEQGSSSSGPSMRAEAAKPKKRPRESEGASGPFIRPPAPQIRNPTEPTSVVMADASVGSTPEIPFGPGGIPPMPIAGPSKQTATPAAGLSEKPTIPQKSTSVTETPVKIVKASPASTSKRPLATVNVEKQIAKRLKAQAQAERRQIRALEQAGITKGLDAESDMQSRREKVAQEMEEAYNRSLRKGIGLTVPYQNHALNQVISRAINYEPISAWVPKETARDVGGGEKSNIIAVVRQFAYTPSNGRGGDHRYNIQLQDPSVDKDDFLIVTIFTPMRLPFDTILTPGSVLLIRDVWCAQTPQGRIAGKIQGNNKGWQWACLQLKPDGTTHEHLGTGTQVPRFPDLSEAERHRMLRLKEWWVCVVAPQMNPALLASGGPVSGKTLNTKAEKLMTVSQIQIGVFCDIVLEVIDTWEGNDTGRFTVYGADYTFSELIIDDDRLKAQYPLLNGGGIFEICLWDINSVEARVQQVKAGDFLFLRNVRVRHWNGNVTGALHAGRGGFEAGASWTRMSITDPLVVQLLSRKEDVLQRVPDLEQVTPALPPPLPSDEVEWNAKPNDLIRTAYSNQPYSSIRDVLANSSVPNRFRIKARVSAIRPISRPGEMIIKWCKACQRSFTEEYCHACNDHYKKYAEHRYRFWVVLQDEEGGPKLPCQMEHRSINNLLYKLPDIETDVQNTTPLLTQARTRIKVLLWDHKINGDHPCGVVDWTVESFYVEHPLVPEHRLTMYRVFGMLLID